MGCASHVYVNHGSKKQLRMMRKDGGKAMGDLLKNAKFIHFFEYSTVCPTFISISDNSFAMDDLAQSENHFTDGNGNGQFTTYVDD